MGLEYLHFKDISHFDIKANNILLFRKGVVKICDFGTSLHSSEIKNDEIVGTAGFIAPEFYQYGVKPTRYADI